MDWQQGTDYWWIHEPNTNGNLKDPREAVDPLWMLNHLHILDICRNGKRPMFFSRFSGPGAHRYPIGFSGDTYITWEALKLQPYFTSTASNIGYCWWSHDIGGHMRGCDEPELLTRWIQLGVFSPINRLHSSANEFLHKEPWYFEAEYRSVMENCLRLRHSLFPYLYTMNYRCHTELEPLIQPMYYSYPKCREAYFSPQQYMFGTELMVCAISEKRKWEIGFRAFSADAKPKVSVNGNKADFETYFAEETNTLYIVVSANVTDRVVVTLSAENSLAVKSINRIDLCKKILSDSSISSSEKARILSILENNQTVKDALWKLYCIELFNGPLIYALREILTLK